MKKPKEVSKALFLLFIIESIFPFLYLINLRNPPPLGVVMFCRLYLLFLWASRVELWAINPFRVGLCQTTFLEGGGWLGFYSHPLPPNSTRLKIVSKCRFNKQSVIYSGADRFFEPVWTKPQTYPTESGSTYFFPKLVNIYPPLAVRWIWCCSEKGRIA